MRTEVFTCVCCPYGCKLHAEIDGNKVTKVYGNTCKKGAVYGRSQALKPGRILICEANVVDGISKSVSCRSKSELPKERIEEITNVIQNLQLVAPIANGDILFENICNSGVDIVATRRVAKKED